MSVEVALTWAVPVAIALHNAEEARYLLAWTRRGDGRWRRPVEDCPFRFAVVVLTAAVVAAAVWTEVAGFGSVGQYVLAAFALGQGLNVIAPHLVVTLRTGGYMPGLGSGLALVAPASVALLARGLGSGALEPRILLIVGAILIPVTVAGIPILFRLGTLMICRRESPSAASGGAGYSG